MIISENLNPPEEEFRKLMQETDKLLNREARANPRYFASRGGNPLEDDVKAALEECAENTPFKGTILKVSGQRFPDIVAARYYGVEVKSTKEDHWTSTGSSILESTRIPDVQRIYMTFGKLGGDPIEFLSKPYEECLYGIAVTHMPRYLIDMRIGHEDTIFAKMGVPYDTLRKMENPVTPVAEYYRSRLRPGESLWWAGNPTEEAVAPTIRLWKNLTAEKKNFYRVYGLVNYPEVFGGDYDRYALWLTSQGIVDPHIRDQFSAGGQKKMKLSSGEKLEFPAVYHRVEKNLDEFLHRIAQPHPEEQWEAEQVGDEILEERLWKWSQMASRYCTTVKYGLSMDAWKTLFELE